MTLPYSTRTMARMTGSTISQIYGLIQRGKLQPPAKTESGDFAWTAADADRIREALSFDRRRRQTNVAGAPA